MLGFSFPKIDSPVIHDFRHGWLTFELGDYSCRASYICPTPDDLLDACIEKLSNPWKTTCVKLDEEGMDDTFVVFDDHVFIVKGRKVVCRDGYYKVGDFAQSLVTTIETNLDSVINGFYCDAEIGDVQRRKRILNRKIKTLKNILERRTQWD